MVTVLIAAVQPVVSSVARTDVADAYRAAISKDVDSVVVMRRIGDVPLFAHMPLGKALFQFKTYNQRVLLRGMQEGI